MNHIGLKCICMCMLCFFKFVKLEPSSEPVQLDKYRSIDEINEFLTNILHSHENITEELLIGKSTEGRDIRGIKISVNNETDNSTKPALLLDGGIHAREWVSSVSVLYTIQQLLENSSNYYLIENLDWYIFPMLNPDGYVFSMDPYGDRQWRKNRAINLLSKCRGVDLNRNFGFAWGGDGSSDNPCDWSYRGSHPFSEPESKSFAHFVYSKMPQIKMYLTLHSAAQAIIYPWGFSNERPPDWQELDALARKATGEMMKINKTNYIVGPTTETVGVGAGGSDDWAKGSAGIKYVYTMELPGLHYPQGGFHPPETELDIISQETFQGIKVFASHLIEIFSNATQQVEQVQSGLPLTQLPGNQQPQQPPGMVSSHSFGNLGNPIGFPPYSPFHNGLVYV